MDNCTNTRLYHSHLCEFEQYVHSPAGAVKWSALGLCTGLIGAGIWSCWFRGDRCVYSKINIVLITMVVEAALVYTGVAFFLLP